MASKLLSLLFPDISSSVRTVVIATGAACLLPIATVPALAQVFIPGASVIDANAEPEFVAQATDVPAALQASLDAMIAAANGRDIEAVMSLYAPEFEHGDDLSLAEVQSAIESLWDRHPELDYSATVVDWEDGDEGLVAEIVTEITGTQAAVLGSFQLEGTTSVRNVYVASPVDPNTLLLQSQTILAESTTLTSGDMPPDAVLTIPETVSVGSVFDVEAVLEEPLGDRLLLGTALEEPINAETYLEAPPLPLETLQAGGIFRRADAPIRPGSEWISVMLVSDDGILIEGRRLNVVIGPVD